MAKLYGLANYLMSEIVIKLLNHKEFTKFVYYKDVSDKDILSLPDLKNPSVMLRNQIFRNRRTPKILETQDVCIFMSLDDIRNYGGSKTKKIKTIWIDIGFIVHQSCSNTIHGSREVAIISAIEKALDGTFFSKAIGTCEIDRVVPLAGIPYEWNGYQVRVKLDGFSDVGTDIYEVDYE